MPVTYGTSREAVVAADWDCAFEAICEFCSFVQTSRRPTLQPRHDDVEAKGQHHSAALLNRRLGDLRRAKHHHRTAHGSPS
jgi:hypothetical protein